MNESNKSYAVIFDMDGVIIDNHDYHTKAWEAFWDKHNLLISEEEYLTYINGRTNDYIMRYLFGEDTSQERVDALAFEKEKLYRDLYIKDIVIAKGLDRLLITLSQNNYKLAVASAGPPENVNFALDALNIRQYFSSVIDSSMVKEGKPDPEAYLKTLDNLKVNPEQAVIFEDSAFGIQAAEASGCNVVAISTTLSKEKLKLTKAHKVIDSFEEVDVAYIQNTIQERLKNA